MQNTKELADAKAEMMLCVMLPLVVVFSAHQSSLSVSAWSHLPLPAWIMQPPPRLADTGWTGLFHPQREADHYAKTTGREPRSILMSSDRAGRHDGQLMQLLQGAPRFQRRATLKATKPSNPFTNVCWFRFNNIFCVPPNFGCIDSFLLPNSRNEEMMGDGFGATAAGLFWTATSVEHIL